MSTSEQQIREEYYLLGVKYAMDKLSKDSKTKSKVIKKSVGRSLVAAGQTASKIPEVSGKLTSGFATGGQRAIGKVLKNKLNPVRLFSNIADTTDLATAKGRERLKNKYSLMTEKKDSPDAFLSDIISLALPTNPIDQVAAGSRMMDRARKGAKVYGKEVEDTAKATNNNKPMRVEKLTELADRLPKFKD